MKKFISSIHYLAIDKTILAGVIRMIYLMSYVNYLNNLCGWFYELPCNGLEGIPSNWFGGKLCPM